MVFWFSWPLKYLCLMASIFFWRKYAHPFNFLLRNHLDSTLTLRNPEKANFHFKHACAEGRPLPFMVFWLSWPLKYPCSSGSWHLTSSCASTSNPFNFLLRNHLDSTLIVRNPQKANLQKKHARGGGRPLPELRFYAFLALLAFEVCLLNGI